MPIEADQQKELILQQLPDVWDADHLGDFLLDKARIVSEYCGRDVTIVLQHFRHEEDIKAQELHDPSNYLTIQFSQEGVSGEDSSREGIKFDISPREVVRSLSTAMEILDRGWGQDAYAAMNNRPALSLSDLRHMTLDWVDSSTLTPAFRYKVGEVNISQDHVKKIVSVIQKGRSGETMGRGGLIKAGLA